MAKSELIKAKVFCFQENSLAMALVFENFGNFAENM